MTPASENRLKVAALIASRNRPDLVADAVANLRQTVGEAVDLDCIVIECGTSPDKLSQHSTITYADPDFRGKCFGHNVGLDYARRHRAYDYYWVLHNDVRFDGQINPALALIEALESDDRMAICSPMNIDGHFPQGHPQDGRDWHAVCLCDYLGFMMRADVVEEVGFLDGSFKYCWGAIHELAYKLNTAGYFIAYHDRLMMKHLGGSTYGAPGTNTIGRDDYQLEAARFAHDTMRRRYGENWDELFYEAAAPYGIEFNTFEYHRKYWGRAFSEDELAARNGRLDAAEQRCGIVRPSTDGQRVRAPYAATGASGPTGPALAEAASKLHPWFYPVKLGAMQIVPGVGTEWEGAKLANRIACRQTLIVDAVAQRIDLRGKRVLELACNCGYWSARYAERGAAWVLGVEGRPQYVRQAELYWRTNRFLDAGRYQFIEGNIAEEETWRRIQAMGPFDVTICAGILYHIKDYRAVLNWIGWVTTEAIVVDTRVGDEHEQVVREPGDLKFNAIEQTLDKVVPHLPKLLGAVEAAGFDPTVLPVSFAAAPGLTSGDDYTTQRRVTILGVYRTAAAIEPEADDNADAPVQLHLGCGPERRAGWINVDANAAVEPDVVSVAEDLPMFDDDSADAIEACHLFEHFTFDQARAALREWHRVLKPEGRLHLELPNLAACIDMIGEHEDPQGYDLGMIGLYGYPPAISAEGEFQIHKWGWTPGSLSLALREAGFTEVQLEPITQTWRRAAKVGRDMRVTARKAATAPAGV